MKRLNLIFILLLLLNISIAQNINYVRVVDSILSTPEFAGRGYVDKGENKAASYIASELDKMGLEKFSKSYLQPFKFAINTITSIDELTIDGKVLTPGTDFLIAANSPSVSGQFEVVYLPDSLFENKEAVKAFFAQPNIQNKFVITEKRFAELKYVKDLPVKGLIYVNSNRIYWHVSKARKQNTFVTIDINDSLVPMNIKQIELGFKAKYLSAYKANNVVGYVKGKKYPEKYVMFTAHFDHLGKMGKEVYFPGASDNASGVATLLSLAQYFSLPDNQPDYSVIFAFVSGEEVGLLGSFHLAENPLFDLKKIRWLINMDMVGTGSKGISVVNANFYPEIHAALKKINDEKNYLVEVKERGESCNSDHCPFHQKGVPSVFIYTMGDENKEYHTVTDTYDRMKFTEYEDFFRLIVDFVNLP